MKVFFQHKDKRTSFQEKSAHIRLNQAGFNLIEVMISAFVLSVGILGIIGLQAMSVKGTHQSFMRHQATHLIQNLTEKMRANIDGTKASSYVINSDNINCATPITPVTNCATDTATCSATELATFDINRLFCGYKSSTGFSGGIRSSLSNGKLEIACQTTGTVAAPISHCDDGLINIKLSWVERALDKATDGNITPDFLQIDTRIAE